MSTMIAWLLSLFAPRYDYRPTRLSVLLASGLVTFRGAQDRFPEVPEDLSGLSDDEIASLLEEYGTVTDAILDEITDGDTSGLAELEAAAPIAEALRGAQQDRATAAAAAATAAAELADRIRGPQADGEGDGEGDEGEPAPATGPTEGQEDEGSEGASAEATPAADPVTAGGERRPAPAPAPASARRRPVTPRRDETPMALVASGEGLNVPVGRAFESQDSFFEAVAQRVEQTRGVQGTFPLARITARIPDDDPRALRPGDYRGNMRKIEAVTGPRALAASGGLCAPATPYYELQTYSVAERPVRAILPSFNATRGGIIFKAPLTLASITTAVGRITAAQDAAGGTSATKTFQRVTCPSSTEVDIAAIYEYVEFGELGMRTYPEQVEQFMQLVDAAWARKAEVALLDGISAASTTVTAIAPTDGTSSLGLYASLVGEIAAVVAAYRQRHRTSWDQLFRCLIPEWLLTALMVDQDRRVFDDSDLTLDQLRADLGKYGVSISIYKDSATGDNQVMGGPLSGVSSHTTEPLPFPSAAVSFIFPEGTFLFLDGGTLDLGMLRDSALASTNDVRFFQESFENVAFVGVESIKLVSPVCVSGVMAGSIVPACNNHLV